MESINFSYPEFGIGFHSGWNENNNSPTNRLTLSSRKKVNLKKSSFKILKSFSIKFPLFMLKCKEKGEMIGLSSGVGSTILKYEDSFFKIKRNGFKDIGFVDKKINDRRFSTQKKGLYEESFFEAGGAMSLKDAQREIEYEELIRKIGIKVPQRTIALFEINLPFKKDDAVALIQKIESDFRADELISIILFNLFYNIYGNKCLLEIEKGNFHFPSHNLKDSVKILEEKRYFLEEIAKIIGGIYKKFHQAGYLRGIGNSWYGNEIICNDGEVGVCDLESCFSLKEVGDSKTFRLLCETDLNLARTAFYDSMNYFDNSIASMFASILIEGFNQGYSLNYSSRLSLNEISDEINSFLKIKDIILI
jgi:hypothetical protein